MNIIQKLIEVRKSVPYLQKDNKGYQFSYVSSSQTLGSLKKAMDAQGLLLIPSVKTQRVQDHVTAKGAHQYFTVLEMEFMWVNADKPDEKIVCQWTGQGLDDGEKGVGKALTYAEKYFMLKFFNIPTDKDDPDSFQKDTDKGNGKAVGKAPAKPQEPQQAPKPDVPEPEYPEFEGQAEMPMVEKVSEQQAKALLNTMKRNGLTEQDYINSFTFKVVDTPKTMHQEAIKWMFDNKKEKAA